MVTKRVCYRFGSTDFFHRCRITTGMDACLLPHDLAIVDLSPVV